MFFADQEDDQMPPMQNSFKRVEVLNALGSVVAVNIVLSAMLCLH